MENKLKNGHVKDNQEEIPENDNIQIKIVDVNKSNEVELNTKNDKLEVNDNGKHKSALNKRKSELKLEFSGVDTRNNLNNGTTDLLTLPRSGPRMSFMEEESVKERLRLSLLKQCSAILKQGDEKYTKESLHKAFQDEVSSFEKKKYLYIYYICVYL